MKEAPHPPTLKREESFLLIHVYFLCGAESTAEISLHPSQTILECLMCKGDTTQVEKKSKFA